MLDLFACCSSARASNVTMEAAGGIGVGWEQDSKGNCFVSNVLPDGPAAESGALKRGDILVNVDGQIPTNMESLRRLIRGTPGTVVTLVLQSNNNNGQYRVQLQRRNMNRDSRIPESTFSYNKSSNTGSTSSIGGYSSSVRPTTLGTSYGYYSSPSSSTTAAPVPAPAAARQSSLLLSDRELYGIGVTFYLNQKGSWSVDVVHSKDRDADQIQPDDELVKVDGRDVEYSTTEEIAALVLGKKGSVAQLCFRRNEKTFSVMIGRQFATGRLSSKE